MNFQMRICRKTLNSGGNQAFRRDNCLTVRPNYYIGGGFFLLNAPCSYQYGV